MTKIVFIYFSCHKMHEAWLKGINATMVPFIPKIFGKKETTGYKIQVHNNIIFKLPFLHQILSIINCINVPKADIYVLEGIATILPALIRGGKDSKIILINSDTFFYNLEKSNWIIKKIYRWYLKHVDGIISTSEYMRTISRKYTKVPNVVVYPGIDKKFLRVSCDTDSENIAHGMSGLRMSKGIDIAVEAFLKLNGSGKLYLIGPVTEKIAILGKNKSNEKIIITGWTDNPEKYLEKCGIYVNPARFEPFGMNIVEAMAAGFAPIVSENCGAKEVVAKLSPRLIIKPTVSEIIKAIRWLNEGKRKATLAGKAKEIAKDHTIDKSVSNFKKEFNDLIDEMEGMPTK